MKTMNLHVKIFHEGGRYFWGSRKRYLWREKNV